MNHNIIDDEKVTVEHILPESWLLVTKDGIPIANFVPEVTPVDVYDVYNGTSDPLPHVRIRLRFRGGQRINSFLVLRSKINRIVWSNIDDRCKLNTKFDKAREYITHYIQSKLTAIPATKLYRVNHIGVHEFEDVVFFNVGNKIILPPDAENKFETEVKPLPQRLDIDIERYSEPAAVTGMMNLIRLSPNAGRVCFAQALSGIMRTAYMAAGVTPCTVIQVVSDSGMLKTTFVPLLTQLYNRNDGIKPITRLNATPAFIEKSLHYYVDCTLVLDDLHPAKSRSIVRQNEYTLEEFIRRVGDNKGRGHMEGNKPTEHSARVNIIALCQYPFGDDSTAARSLVVNITNPIDSVKLDACQEDKLLVSTFYYYYIKWFIENYQEIVNLLKEWRKELRGTVLDVHKRLKETYFVLNTAYFLFFQYCVEKEFVTAQDAEYLHDDFKKLLITLVSEQNERYERSKFNKSDTDYLKKISTKLKSGRLRLADNMDEFVKDFSGKYDGLIYDNCLCLRGIKLRKLFPVVRLDEVVSALSDQGALKRGRDKRTIQINGGNGKRFYAIPLVMLK